MRIGRCVDQLDCHTHALDGKQGSADCYLFGRAAGPFIAGVLSDVWGLTAALTAMPAFGLLAPLAFSFAARTYEADMRRAGQSIDVPASTPAGGARNALAAR